MKSTLFDLFTAAKSYVEQGISVVPIDDNTGRRLFAYTKKPELTKDLDAIFKAMSNADGSLKLALITGGLSKNLECLDIDEKYKPGISAEYLSIIKQYYPEIYSKLRIEKTKNNGLHIYYTLDEGHAIAKDIAKRLATEEELQKRPDLKKYAFIEVKSNNSSFTCYPSNGYTLLQDNPIPHLTQEERDILINIAKGYNEVIEKVVEVKVSKKLLRNYSTNPWEDYNSDESAFLLLLDKHGWTPLVDRGNEVRFARPGKKKDVAACYYRDKQLFIIYGTNTGLDSGNYKPSTILSLLDFNNDKKECFAWLIENGYGKLTRQYETRLIKRAIVNNVPLPGNISKEAREEYEAEKDVFENKYPYGIFWEQVEERGAVSYRINRELILRVATSLGYRLYRGDLVFVDEKIIKNAQTTDFYNDLKTYVKEDDDTNIVIFDKFEKYIQQAGDFLITRLPKIEEKELLHDTYDTCYKAFANIILEVTKKGVREIEWSKVDKFVLDKKVIDYNYKKTEEKGLFVEFLNKAILDHSTLRQKVGWMVHDYNDSINPYFLLLIETVLDPKLGGGSGKDLFANLVGRMTTIHGQDGSNVKIDKTLFQSWKGQRLMLLSDIEETFKFHKLKTIVSNNATVKYLYKNERSISVKYLPKIVCTSNYSFETKDGGVDRRLRFVEFSDFFTKSGGVWSYFGGKRFPREGMDDDWEEEDWDGYYNYVINSIVDYFNNPILGDIELTESGWKKQFVINHGQNTFDFIVNNIENFRKKKSIPQSDFQTIYDRYCVSNGIQLRYKKSAQGLNSALEDYCRHYDIDFEKSKSKSINSIVTNCKIFGTDKDEELPF